MEFFSTDHQFFYNIISDYYDNPKMIKIKDEENTMSLYGIQLHSQFLNERYYLICTSPFSTEESVFLKHIAWTSFQVRTLTNDKYSYLPKIMVSPKKEPRYDIPISIKSRNNEISIYEAKKYPFLIVNLLHSKGIEYEYANEGTLKSALDTKQTIIQFKKE
jgi:hypothetical protein